MNFELRVITTARRLSCCCSCFDGREKKGVDKKKRKEKGRRAIMSFSGGGWSSRRSRPVKSERDVLDLGATFGVNVGSDSDSSDAEFAPEKEEKDSGDSSGDEGGDEEEEEEEVLGEQDEEIKDDKGVEAKTVEEAEEAEDGKTKNSPPKKDSALDETEAKIALKDGEGEGGGGGGKEEEGGGGGGEEEDKKEGEGGGGGGGAAEQEYNPLITRRSNRAIKPTKDIDLYLLGAKFGIDVDGLSGGGEDSDVEFAPADDSPDSLSESSMDDDSGGGKRKTKGKDEEEEEKDGEEDIMEVGTEASTLKPKASSEDEFSRSVSEMSINQEALEQAKVEVHVALCAVCLEDSMDGDIVECDGCGISVHEGCYGVPEEEGGGGGGGGGDDKSSVSSFTTIPWFCDPCKAGVNPLDCACELCPMRGGLYKQATNGQWVHMVCSLYTPGIEYIEPSVLSGVTLDCLSAARWGAKRCQLCEDEFYGKTGVCIGCDAGLCKSYFHATCAQKQGLLCEVDSDDENTDVADPYFAHCRAHSDKTIMKRKRRDFLTVVNQQKRFKFDDSNERTLQYLSEAKVEYIKFFKKMINYYRPELTAHFEDRFFHFKPSALRRLTRKAQLLGYNIEMESGVSRRKVVPDLTTEFVNHFNERQNREKELKELEKQLTVGHRDLREEEMKMKHKVVSLEKEVNSLKIEGQKLAQEISALLSLLSRLTGETVMEEEGDEKEKEVVEEVGGDEKTEIHKSGLPECVVCEREEDGHLMALCDTCKKHYHIHCLDPPLSRVPKKTNRWGWQCHRCCIESGDDLAPTIANFDEPASRCGRRINAPKVFTFPEDQVKQTKTSKKSASKSKKKT